MQAIASQEILPKTSKNAGSFALLVIVSLSVCKLEAQQVQPHLQFRDSPASGYSEEVKKRLANPFSLHSDQVTVKWGSQKLTMEAYEAWEPDQMFPRAQLDSAPVVESLVSKRWEISRGVAFEMAVAYNHHNVDDTQLTEFWSHRESFKFKVGKATEVCIMHDLYTMLYYTNEQGLREVAYRPIDPAASWLELKVTSKF